MDKIRYGTAEGALRNLFGTRSLALVSIIDLLMMCSNYLVGNGHVIIVLIHAPIRLCIRSITGSSPQLISRLYGDLRLSL